MGENAAREQRINQGTATTNALQGRAKFNVVALFHQVTDSPGTQRRQRDLLVSPGRDGHRRRVGMMRFHPVDQLKPASIRQPDIDQGKTGLQRRNDSLGCRHTAYDSDIIRRANQFQQKTRKTMLRRFIIFDDERWPECDVLFCGIHAPPIGRSGQATFEGDHSLATPTRPRFSADMQSGDDSLPRPRSARA